MVFFVWDTLWNPLKKTIAYFGFGKIAFQSSDEVEYVLYIWNSTALIEKQVKCCKGDNILPAFGKRIIFLNFLKPE